MLSNFLIFEASATELIITDNLVIRDVDDKTIEHGFFREKRIITLAKGNHTLVIKYKDVFEDLDLAEERLIKSDYFVVKFSSENQKKLRLSTIKITDLLAAELFVKNPELTLLDENQQEVVIELQKLSEYDLAKQVSKVIKSISVPNVVTSSIDNSVSSPTNKKEQRFSQKVINEVDVVPMLKYWWKKASAADRASFLQFIDDVEIKQ